MCLISDFPQKCGTCDKYFRQLASCGNRPIKLWQNVEHADHKKIVLMDPISVLIFERKAYMDLLLEARNVSEALGCFETILVCEGMKNCTGCHKYYKYDPPRTNEDELSDTEKAAIKKAAVEKATETAVEEGTNELDRLCYPNIDDQQYAKHYEDHATTLLEEFDRSVGKLYLPDIPDTEQKEKREKISKSYRPLFEK